MSELKVPDVLTRDEFLKLPPQERESYVREVLRQTVNSNLQGVTIPDLTKKLPFDSRTIEKHFSIMTYTNELYSVRIGPTNLYLPNSKTMHPVFEETLKTDGREYSIYLLNNRLGEYVFIQEKKNNGFIKEIGGGILIPISFFDKFLKYLNETAEKIKIIKRG